MLRTIVNINTRRSFHLTSTAREEWSKASLRRMKKPELVHLAKENNLKLSGTKNEIIIQLLTHQTAKIVGVETPSSLSLPKTKAQPAFGSLDIDSFPNENNSFEADNAWTEAFEMKVAQRGSRKPMADTHDHFTSGSASTPHPMNKQVKPRTLLQPEDITQPSIPVQSEKAAAFEPKKVDISEELEGMDSQWVEAFDLKVGSRGARRDLTDTLSPSTTPSLTPLEGLKFITLDNKENENKEKNNADKDNVEKNHKENDINEKNNKVKDIEVKDVSNKEELKSTVVGKKFDHVKQHSDKHGKQHYHNDNKQDINKDTKLKHEKTKEKTKEKESKDRKDTTDDSSREKWINTTVGSSMILWYIGGEEGISKLWHFLTSSS